MNDNIPTTATATDNVIAVVKDGNQLVAALQTVNPALYAQIVGTLGTYSKSAAAPLVGSALGLLVAHYGLGSYLSAETLSLLTDLLVAAGTAAGAAAMHWWSKRPGRALAAPTQGSPK